LPQGIHSSKNPFVRSALFGIGLLLLSGCGYTLGPTNGLAAGEKNIQITPFLNKTLEPRLGDSVTTALRQNIQHDGTYHLATRGNADIIVTGVVTKFSPLKIFASTSKHKSPRETSLAASLPIGPPQPIP